MTEKEKSPEEGGLISDVNSHKDSENKGITKELLEEIISLPDKPEGKELAPEFDPLKNPETFINHIDGLANGKEKGANLKISTGEGGEALEKYLKIAYNHLVPQNEIIPEPESIFSLNGIPVLTKKSLSTIIAKAKAGKTTVTAWMVAQMLNEGVKILWIDTEQGLYYASRTQHWILKITGLAISENLQFFDLKIFPPNERIKIIIALLEEGQYDLMVLDGIRDLVFDINSPEEATIISSHLMKWADKSNINIINILHTNKGDNNARGHLGTELMNKSETVLKVEQDEGNNILVSPEFTRGKPFDIFALSRNDEGIPELIEGWKQEEGKERRKALLPVDIAPETHKEILEKVFTETSLTYADLLSGLSAAFGLHGIGLGENKAKTFVSYYVQSGILQKKPVGRKSAYTLL